MCSYNAITPFVLIRVLSAGLVFWLSGSLGTVTFAAVIVFPLGLMDSIMASFTFTSDVAVLASDAEEVDGLLKVEELVHGSEPVVFDQSDVALNKVPFSYDDAHKISQKANFLIRSGSMISLASPSKSGKSPIAKLTIGHWDVASGGIVLGEHDLNKILFSDLASQVSYVLQDNYLFNRTIRESIRMARPDVSNQDVERVPGRAPATGLSAVWRVSMERLSAAAVLLFPDGSASASPSTVPC